MNKLLLALSAVAAAGAIEIDTHSKESICNATSLIQDGLLDYYEGNRYGGTVGIFQPPYYWWQSGEAFGSLLNNWYLCQNDTYEKLIYDAILAQAGPNYDFVPKNQTMVEGNDDQGVFDMTILDAMERNFTAPPKGSPSWLDMNQRVFNSMYDRWDTTSCNGGIRWQIYSWNNGYDYKNAVSTGSLFHIAARLARYTGNASYFQVADTIFDWLTSVNYVMFDDKYGYVMDGASIEQNCTDITRIEWTYNFGIIMDGCAYLYNATNGSAKWEQCTTKLLAGAKDDFFDKNDIMYEAACQTNNKCNNDQRSFKALLARFLGTTSVLAPYTESTIKPMINASAIGAAKSCNGGYDGHTCGLSWQKGTNDGYYGMGEQMSALEIIQNLLINDYPPPLVAPNGGCFNETVNDTQTRLRPPRGLNVTSRTTLNGTVIPQGTFIYINDTNITGGVSVVLNSNTTAGSYLYLNSTNLTAGTYMFYEPSTQVDIVGGSIFNCSSNNLTHSFDLFCKLTNSSDGSFVFYNNTNLVNDLRNFYNTTNITIGTTILKGNTDANLTSSIISQNRKKIQTKS
ncbi:hypothetical protein TBLA_0C03850 [Henningerozyma blattae CBS 6284]|uniref:mannan endo-1,6-alpha-mannosidase n=1 Tax=Henningerozyma blattae (strain ATCC 34711 / CBS 6284 / DSM 70876 / NBRC 10599 / NRRL Y-10934 / UCD 77-7) TaxID=1071380 RepID=I2H1D4_HENB6|nr:hypothetical protein TBLA_0C03850 [Tetrapisispora blattae CBS 6284]CCH60186.1 hypothetical protein TBLA_0C03850 [Tetrapisispora blattae CBS 6284]